jgi:hypothetical protein
MAVELEKLKVIIGKTKCPKGFECVKSRFQKLCKAKACHSEFAYCLDADPTACPFAVSFGLDCMCSCPVRLYLVNASTP